MKTNTEPAGKTPTASAVHPGVSPDDPCKCGVGDEEGLRINYDFVAGDAIVIHNPNEGGCGKYMRYWSRD